MGNADDSGLSSPPVAAWTVLGESVLGASHVRDARPNQDAWLADTLANGVVVMAVADGHGGALHCRSDRGSRFAAECAIAVMHAWRDDGDFERFSRQFPASLVTAWRERVSADLDAAALGRAEVPASGLPPGRGVDELFDNPVLAYGTTVLVAIVRTDRIWFAQLGDGDCLAVDGSGTVRRPVPGDDALAGNMTTSLCQQDAAAQFRTAQIGPCGADDDARMRLVLLSTDGYANAFKTDRDFLQIGGDYLNWIDEQGVAAVARQLPEVLAEATLRGSGDDVTLLMAYSTNRPLASGVAKGHPGGVGLTDIGLSGKKSARTGSARSPVPTWIWAWAALATIAAALAIGWPVLQPRLDRSVAPDAVPARPPGADQSSNSGAGVRRAPRSDTGRGTNQGAPEAGGKTERGQP